ncbi:MAG: succinylglutamate desuccinylase/aspartoacylase family protein [Desulfovibrionaceae bacterium]|nr:succinylglutamate desuccinylase/aspartoacylase family protein [Desulfovibrionaceae bacterium]MBR5704780.1 succinylglutamate desuccinylase/aspartoacylase family protein [Deltaproteobacteria bacterium]MBR5734847.1 succinylglutamate desuccinylase/aspartoacylase family protein [Desulfovibrionaceae bacterium]
MIKEVISAELSVGETLMIQKNRIEGADAASHRLAVVTGTHGDELEGQYVAWQLARTLAKKKNALCGTVDIYPALNPLGISTIYRGLPGFDLDMNRIFPGSRDETMYEYIADGIMRDIQGADLCIDIHASNIFLREIPQVRINEKSADVLTPLARLLNMDFIWIHSAATVLESTLAYSLNALHTPTLVVEMGVGMRITKSYGDQLITGILSVMRHLGMLKEPAPPVAPPIVSTDGSVSFVNANESGFFIPQVRHADRVEQGQLLGLIADPMSGGIQERLLSPISGLVFTLREYPVVNEGSLIARILGGSAG